MAALRDGPQPDRHLLDVVGHGHEDEKDPEKVEPVLRARDGVGGDSAGVVVRNHGDDARPENGQKEDQTDAEPSQAVYGLAEPIHNRPSPEFGSLLCESLYVLFEAITWPD